MNKLVLFAGTDQTRETLANQLKEYLPDYIELSSFAIDEYLPELLPDGLIVISSRLAYEELLEFWDLDKISSRLIIARRTIDFPSRMGQFFTHLDNLLEIFIGKAIGLIFKDTQGI